MENVVKKFKLISAGLILTSCLFPFITVGFSIFGSGWGMSINGFSLLWSVASSIVFRLSMLLVLGGAAALIYVDASKKDITLFSKFTLSFAGKLSAIAGGGIILIAAVSTAFVGIGFGLVLELIVAVSLLFEDKIVAAIKKGSTPPAAPPQEN
jgi:hypothetical protein